MSNDPNEVTPMWAEDWNQKAEALLEAFRAWEFDGEMTDVEANELLDSLEARAESMLDEVNQEGFVPFQFESVQRCVS